MCVETEERSAGVSFSFTLWAPGIELRSSVLAASTFTHQFILQSFFVFLKFCLRHVMKKFIAHVYLKFRAHISVNRLFEPWTILAPVSLFWFLGNLILLLLYLSVCFTVLTLSFIPEQFLFFIFSVDASYFLFHLINWFLNFQNF